MRLEGIGSGKMFLFGLFGFLIVGAAWLRYGDVPTYLESIAQEQGRYVESSDRLRSARVEVHELAAVDLGLHRERRSIAYLTIKDNRRGDTETWALPAMDGRQLDLSALSLRWSAPDRVELHGFTKGVLALELAGAGR